MRRGMTSTVVVAVLGAVAAMILLLWGSANGTPLVGSPQGTWGPPPISFPPLEGTITATIEPTLGAEEPREAEGRAVDWLLIGFILLIAAALLIVLRLLLSRQRREAEPLSPIEDAELAALLEASGDDVRYRALAESDPRNAVVACWVALEEAVQSSGLQRDPSETASELTARVLSRWQVDQGAIRELSAAYREARFSRHPVTEQQRDTAIAAVQRIHEDLRSRVMEEQIRQAQALAAQQERDSETADAPTSPPDGGRRP